MALKGVESGDPAKREEEGKWSKEWKEVEIGKLPINHSESQRVPLDRFVYRNFKNFKLYIYKYMYNGFEDDGEDEMGQEEAKEVTYPE